MKKKEICLLSMCTFFMGMVAGFMIAPIKDGIGNNAGNTTYNYYNDDKNEDEIED